MSSLFDYLAAHQLQGPFTQEPATNEADRYAEAATIQHSVARVACLILDYIKVDQFAQTIK